MRQIVIRPVITEKTYALAAKGWYTFAVLPASNKAQVAGEITRLYGVNITAVRTVSVHGKTRRVGRRMLRTRKQDWKKAIVRLREGQKIEAFEVATEGEKK